MTLKALRIKVRASPCRWKNAGFRLSVCPPDFQRASKCHAPYPPHLQNRDEIHAFPLHRLVVRTHEVTRKVIWKLRVLFLIIASASPGRWLEMQDLRPHPRPPESECAF